MCEITGKVYINIQPLTFSMFSCSIEHPVQLLAPKEVRSLLAPGTAQIYLLDSAGGSAPRPHYSCSP